MAGPPVLIVGGGLAGISVATALYEAGRPFLVIDKPLPGGASEVAAGIINPIVFKRLALSWGWDEFYPVASAFYQAWEARTEARFFSPVRVRRQMPGSDEIKQWEGKRAESDLHHSLLSPVKPISPDFLIRPRSEFEAWVEGAALLDVPRFMNAARTFFKEKGFWREEYFEYQSLEQRNQGLYSYLRQEFFAVIFCEGYRVMHNPFFPNQDIIPCKGEVLEFSNPGLPENEIQYRKVNLVPFGENMLAGSNYHNHDFREGPDEDGLAEIEKLARESFRVELELKNQRWGIRPTTHDRRPRIIQHPNWKNLWMFNGLGSKGALSGPLLARNFVKEDLYGN